MSGRLSQSDVAGQHKTQTPKNRQYREALYGIGYVLELFGHFYFHFALKLQSLAEMQASLRRHKSGKSCLTKMPFLVILHGYQIEIHGYWFVLDDSLNMVFFCDR